MASIGTRLDLMIIFLMFLSIVSNNVFARNNTLNKSVSATIVKEGMPPFYYMNINGEDYIMDLDSDFLWTRCDKWHVFHQPCPKQACALAHSWPSRLCPLKKDQQERLCPCKVALVNPVPKTCHQTDLTYAYYFFFNQTGHWPFEITFFKQIYAACIPSELRVTQFYNRTGQFVGLSKAPLSLPSQVASQYHFAKKFAFVLPSVRYPHGLIFFGGGPYYIVYYADKLQDATGFFTYTRLLQNTLSTTNGYYIEVQAISIGSSELHQIPIKASSFDINYTTGLGGVRISTIVLYTTLRSDIFLAFRKTFLEAMVGKIPVRAVKPFDLCFNASDLALNPLGGYIGAPKVELSLANGKNWTYFSNTMQAVYNDTLACMAFIDGGKTMEEAMVIGAFQMEEIFVEFDLVKSQFGFTPNLFLLEKFNGSITG